MTWRTIQIPYILDHKQAFSVLFSDHHWITRLFDNRSQIYYLNTRQVQYSDGYHGPNENTINVPDNKKIRLVEYHILFATKRMRTFFLQKKRRFCKKRKVGYRDSRAHLTDTILCCGYETNFCHFLQVESLLHF